VSKGTLLDKCCR